MQYIKNLTIYVDIMIEWNLNKNILLLNQTNP